MYCISLLTCKLDTMRFKFKSFPVLWAAESHGNFFVHHHCSFTPLSSLSLYLPLFPVINYINERLWNYENNFMIILFKCLGLGGQWPNCSKLQWKCSCFLGGKGVEKNHHRWSRKICLGLDVLTRERCVDVSFSFALFFSFRIVLSTPAHPSPVW